jgi:hypothetical protein
VSGRRFLSIQLSGLMHVNRKLGSAFEVDFAFLTSLQVKLRIRDSAMIY